MQLANQKGFKEAIHHLGPPMTEWWNDMHATSTSSAEHTPCSTNEKASRHNAACKRFATCPFTRVLKKQFII
jgi:hypothetical protein